jgi:nucleoside-diphosphate-sugar epimerase
MKKRTVLLTGSTGYIGTVMTKALKDASYRVVGLDNNWFYENLLYPVPDTWLPDSVIVRDIRDVRFDDLVGIDAVVHLAGLSNDPLGEINPSLTDDINFRATVRLGELCKARGIERFIFASSCSIYGLASTDRPISEKGTISPLTAYARAKVYAERGLSDIADRSFHPVYMRNATVYGLSPRLRLDLVVNNLLAWAYLTGELAIMSDGTPWRPIIHVEDFCSAFIAALEAPAEAVSDQAFNVGIDSENYQVRDIAERIREALPSSKISILKKTGGDDRSYRVDFSKIRKSLPGFRPRWTLSKGIGQLHDAYKSHHLTLEDFNSDRYFRLRSIKSLMASGKVSPDLVAARSL